MRAVDRQVLRVLIAGNFVQIVESMGVLMRMEGHSVATAHDALSAIACTAKFQPSVVLLDLTLPGVLSLGVAQRIRARVSSPTLIIGLALDAPLVAAQRALDAGCDRHLSRPVNFDELRKLLSSQQRSGPFL